MAPYYLQPSASAAPGRNAIGGRPILPLGFEWPRCACGERMVFFFQFDVPEELLTFGGAHFAMFQCPVHNDAWGWFKGVPPSPLPAEYMTARWSPPGVPMGRFWRAFLHRDPELTAPTSDSFLLHQGLEAGPIGQKFLQVGGDPEWLQDEERHTCSCGAEMSFLAQLGENAGFRKRPNAPQQPSSWSHEDYGLFLGNAVIFLACSAMCDPRAVWPVNQH